MFSLRKESLLLFRIPKNQYGLLIICPNHDNLLCLLFSLFSFFSLFRPFCFYIYRNICHAQPLICKNVFSLEKARKQVWSGGKQSRRKSPQEGGGGDKLLLFLLFNQTVRVPSPSPFLLDTRPKKNVIDKRRKENCLSSVFDIRASMAWS